MLQHRLRSLPSSLLQLCMTRQAHYINSRMANKHSNVPAPHASQQALGLCWELEPAQQRCHSNDWAGVLRQQPVDAQLTHVHSTLTSWALHTSEAAESITGMRLGCRSPPTLLQKRGQ